jgi:membrane protein DedA with SNARE-associated domain
LISTWEMDFWLVFISWTFGALVGSSINYLLGFFLWEKAIKALINKYGKYLFVRLEHYEKAEKYFQIHGVITTFIWRFITVIRQYISLPAGVFKMNFLKFIIYTGIWAWIWNLILMAIWYIAWENKELITEYFGKVSIWLIIFIVIVLAVYIFVHKKIYAKKIK